MKLKNIFLCTLLFVSNFLLGQITNIDKNWIKNSTKSDDFSDSTSLWQQEWDGYIHEDPTDYPATQCYVVYKNNNNNVLIQNGKLKLIVKYENPAISGQRDGQTYFSNYSSGWYRRTDSLGYGYFEARMTGS